MALQETIGAGSDVGGQGVGEPTGSPSALGRGCWGDDVPAKKAPSRDGYMPTIGPLRPIVNATWDFNYLNFSTVRVPAVDGVWLLLFAMVE